MVLTADAISFKRKHVIINQGLRYACKAHFIHLGNKISDSVYAMMLNVPISQGAASFYASNGGSELDVAF